MPNPYNLTDLQSLPILLAAALSQSKGCKRKCIFESKNLTNSTQVLKIILNSPVPLFLLVILCFFILP